MQQRFYSKVTEWAKVHANPERIFAIMRAMSAWLGSHTRFVSLFLGALIVGGLAIAAIRPVVMSASEVNVLANGSFEQGFHSIPGCGVVGKEWTCFTNGGVANYGFYDDQWERVVADGKHSQLIEINTHGLTAPDHDRYAGIAQTVRVRPNAPYTFDMRGMIRTSNPDGEDPWRYRVEVGWLPKPNADWREVENWIDVGWNTYYERTNPGHMSPFSTTLRPNSEVITIFVRVWKKWGVPNEELDVNLDAISLHGPAPAPVRSPGHGPHKPDHGPKPEHPGPGTGVGGPVSSPPGYTPAQPEKPVSEAVACSGPNLIENGNFEGGFVPAGAAQHLALAHGEVGRGWSTFTNGGAIHVDFRAEEWSRVISDGSYGQAIDLSSKSLYPTDADRYAGIAQRIGGLQPGRTYELSLRGLIRGTDGNHDDYRFEAQWGFTEGHQSDWQQVKNWERLDLGAIQAIEEPVSMHAERVRFTAPSSSIVLYIRAWKKWAVTNEVMILNLDEISLRTCGGVGGPVHGEPIYGEPVHGGPHQPPVQSGSVGPPKPGPVQPDKPQSCTYTVRQGDTLSGIAQRVGVSMQEIIRLNRIANPNHIYVGQELTVPCDHVSPQPKPPIGPGPRPDQGHKPTEPEKPQQPTARTYTVRAGDTLSGIAVRFNVSQQQLAHANGIRNANHIYVGQVLRIP